MRGLAELETEDIEAYPILSTGGPIHGQGSPPEGDYLTVDDLRKFETAYRELGREADAPIDFRKPPAKIGHSKDQRLARASGFVADDAPALGWLDNLRLDGDRLLADLRRVPKTLAALVRSGAFRKRSIEWKTHRSQKTGKEYTHVITGLAFLGAKAPAVKTLDDIVALYGDEQLEGVRTYDVPAESNDPSSAATGGDPIQAALEDGRIASESRQLWERLYAKQPALTASALAEMRPRLEVRYANFWADEGHEETYRAWAAVLGIEEEA